MRHWTDEETGITMCEPDCCDEWLEFIWMIGCDYDGCKSVEELKTLVDELVEMSQKARGCLHDGYLFSDTTSGCAQKVKHELRKLIAEIPLLRWCVGNCKCEEHEGRSK